MGKTLFFTRSLDAGGAERQLVITAKGLKEEGGGVSVLTFYDGGFYAPELLEAGVELFSLHKKGRWDIFSFIFRLIKIVRRLAPSTIYSFLGTANILSVFIPLFLPGVKVYWGIRASNMDLSNYDWVSRLSYWLECRLSSFANTIVSNSHAGMDYAVSQGIPKRKMEVIPNGIDTDKFYSDRLRGQNLRQEWGIGKGEMLVGMVGRFDPMKGHSFFLRAAASLVKKYPCMRFVCVGEGNVDHERSLLNLSSELGLDGLVVWAGRHGDMCAVYNALDLFSSSSIYGEGFSNAIGEAMACNIPCVVTDVGDGSFIVGETGMVVPAYSAEKLASAWEEMLSLLWEDAGPKGMRQRILDQFSLKTLIGSTKRLLDR